MDNVCNNTCDSLMLKYQIYIGKPILTFAEEVKCYIMKTMSTNKLKLEGITYPLCPMQPVKLEKKNIESNKWTPIWFGDESDNRFEVQNWQQKIDVNLNTRKCTCRMWQWTENCLF